MPDNDSSPFVPVHGLKPSTRSGFGKQASSVKVTAPNYSLGKSTRDQAGKVFLSTQHVNVENRCRTSPGPAYNLPSSMEKQVMTEKQTAPQFSFTKAQKLKFRSSEFPGPGQYSRPSSIGPQPDSSRMTLPTYRFPSSTRGQNSKVFLSTAHVQEQRGTHGAAPGAYDAPDSIGQQASSQKASSPGFSMPRQERLKSYAEKTARAIPGAGQYNTWSAIGQQPLSTSLTLPAHAFGSSTRSSEGKRFLTLGHASKMLMGTATVNYDHQRDNNFTSIGRQNLSHRATSPAHRFGTGPKLVFRANDSPGPGAYD